MTVLISHVPIRSNTCTTRQARKKVIQWETERELEGPPPASATRVRVGLLLHNGRWMSPKKDGAGPFAGALYS